MAVTATADTTADPEAGAANRARLLDAMNLALHLIAERLHQRAERGPSLFDQGEAVADPAAELRAAWREWLALDADMREYRLAWAVGACRLLGVTVRQDGGGLRVDLGRWPEDAVRPVLALLRESRPAVAERFATGQPFDCPDWQKALVAQAAGGWPVYGWRTGAGDGGAMSFFPVVPTDPPPFYDALAAYRMDAARSIPREAVAVLRAAESGGAVGRLVYVGPAAAEMPAGSKARLAAEAAVRGRHGWKGRLVRYIRG